MVFVMAPLSIATGIAMSPALVNHFPLREFRRPADRPLHSFRAMLGFVGFIVVHVTLVVADRVSRGT